MTKAAIEVRNLKQFRKDLKQLESGSEWAKALTAVNRTTAQKIAIIARAKALGLGGVRQHAASAIRGYATAEQGSVGFNPGGAHPEASVAFWGSKGRSGWYARPQYTGSKKPQHPPWVGNSWEPGVAGQGPYAINAALAQYLPQLEEDYAKALDDLAKAAFPDK